RAASASELTGFQEQQKRNAAKGKARLMDRQANAVRIAFDDSQASQQQPTLPREGGREFRLPSRSSAPAPAPYPVTSSGTTAGGKRHFEQMDDGEPEAFDPTPDEGFQVDTRGTAAADARRQAAPRAQIAPKY
ncbi:hypothetical protein LTR53_019837, partial [Teratosphaeriaceae sp. CCFEE 6253]